MSESTRHVIWGVTFFHTETGTAGGHWAVQDIRGIDLAKVPQPGSWSYYGLLVLSDGDRLTIFDPDTVPARSGPIEDSRIIWQGEIQLRRFPVFTEDALGLWIHAEQEGIARDEWAMWFLREHPCRLETSRPPWPVGRWAMDHATYDGVRVGTKHLYLMSDGSTAWQPYPARRAASSFVPPELLKYIQDRRR